MKKVSPRKMKTSEIIEELVMTGVILPSFHADQHISFAIGRSYEELKRREILGAELDRRLPAR